MGYDLPWWVHLPAFLCLWLPAQGTLVALLLWLFGVYGTRT